MKKTVNSTRSKNTKLGGPWRKIYFKDGRLSVIGHSKALLSKHFLNLRALSAPTSDTAAVQGLVPDAPNTVRLSRTGARVTTNKTAGILPLVKVTNNPDATPASFVTLVARAVILDLKNYFSTVTKIVLGPGRMLRKIPRPRGPRPRLYKAAESSAWSQVLNFLLLGLLVSAPVKVIAVWYELGLQRQQVINFAAVGAEQIKAGTESLSSGNLNQAQQSFTKAADTFASAAAMLQSWPDRLWKIMALIPGKTQQYVSGNYIISASQEMSQAAALAVSAWRTMQSANVNDPANLARNLELTKSAVEQIKIHLDLATEHLDKVDQGTVPESLRTTLSIMQSELRDITNQLRNFVTLPEFISQAIVGQPGQVKTFVLVFQNPSELRPTGGFMGSLAIMQVENGKIKQFNIPGGGPYDYQGQLASVIRPPEPIRLVRGVWQLQDANWWPDFPTSAQKILWFMEKSGAPSADGVMALNATLVVELLKLTGPISLPQYDKILTSANFLRETQKAVEIEYDRRLNRPKQFIADLAPVLLDKILNLPPARQTELLATIDSALAKREIQMYFTSAAMQARAVAYGWAGEIKTTPLDYLALVRTNIGGGKTDAVTADAVSHHATIADDGTITVEVKLTRQHNGNARDLWESRRNVDYVRFYVPRGSVLLEADGFTPPPENYFRPVPPEAEYDQDLINSEQLVGYSEPSGTKISEQFGKTVYANWLSVAPGESATARVLYRLPFILRPDSNWQDLRRYQVYFQRQSGTKPAEFLSQVTLPPAWRLRWQRGSAPLTFDQTSKTLSFYNNWLEDQYYALIVEKTHD